MHMPRLEAGVGAFTVQCGCDECLVDPSFLLFLPGGLLSKQEPRRTRLRGAPPPHSHNVWGVSWFPTWPSCGQLRLSPVRCGSFWLHRRASFFSFSTPSLGPLRHTHAHFFETRPKRRLGIQLGGAADCKRQSRNRENNTIQESDASLCRRLFLKYPCV
jgi:hypothetical protein